MSRRRVAKKRKILPDPVYGSIVLAKFMNNLMYCGKKSVAEKIVYGALAILKNRFKTDDPVRVFERALKHASPLVEVRSRRVGGATYQVPVEIDEDRARALGIRALIDAARKRGEKDMVAKLAGELTDAADEDESGSGKGGAVKKREDMHRMAEANKAFAHFKV